VNIEFNLVCLYWARIIHGSSNTHAYMWFKSLTNICIVCKTFEMFEDACIVKSRYWLVNKYLDLRLLHVEQL